MAGEALSLNSGYLSNKNVLTRNYENYVGLSSGLGALDSDLGSLNSSIMGGFGYNVGYSGYSGYDLYGPEYQNMSLEERLAYQEKVENYQLERQLRQKQKMEYFNFENNSSEDLITRQVGLLQENIRDNQQDKVAESYSTLVSAIKQKFNDAGYTNISEDKVKTYAERVYYEATGVKLTNDIKNNGDCSFVKGLKDGFFGLGVLLNGKTSRAENIANITGEQVSTSSKVGLWAGRIISGAVTLVALPFLLRGGKAGLAKGGHLVAESWLKLFKKVPPKAISETTKVVSETAKVVGEAAKAVK